MNKHSSLQKVYYASFAAMVVVPVLLVFLISLSIIRIMMQNTAVSAIESRQKAAVSSLTESIRDASLQLSHFVYVNNYELMEIAARTDTADSNVRYYYTTQLEQLFAVAMAPKQMVLSGMIYMKDGKDTYLKQMPAISREEVQASRWYQDALARKNQVFVEAMIPPGQRWLPREARAGNWFFRWLWHRISGWIVRKKSIW